MRTDGKIAEVRSRHDALQVPARHAKEGQARSLFGQRLPDASRQNWFNQQPQQLAKAQPYRQRSQVHDVEEKPSSGLEPAMKIFANFLRHR